MSNYILTSEGELYHWGVKGMKWGVRRSQNKEQKRLAKAQKKEQKRLAKAQKKWDRDVSENWDDAYNNAIYKHNPTIESFNAKHPNVNFNDKSKAKYNRKYIEDYCKMWNDIYTRELETRFGKAPIDDGRKWCERVPFMMDPVSEYKESIGYRED